MQKNREKYNKSQLHSENDSDEEYDKIILAPQRKTNCVVWIILLNLSLIVMVVIGFGAGYFYRGNTNPITSESPDISSFASALIGNQRDSNNIDSLPHLLFSPTIKNFQGFARGQWKEIKPFINPTQPDIGYAWAIRKVRKDFSSAEDAQDSMNPIWHDKWPYIETSDLFETAETIPVIIGPTQNENELKFYAIDSHHTLSSLDYSGYDETYVYINVLLDYRLLTYDAFVEEMINGKYTFLYAQKGEKKQLPVMINFNELPETFDFNKDTKTLGDNIWRSLGGYSRKVKNAPDPFPECSDDIHSEYCMRPFVRVCDENGFGIPFYEFQWGYYYVDATYVNCMEHNVCGYWKDSDGDDPYNTFIEKFDNLLDTYYDESGEWTDAEPSKDLEADWRYAASLLVPLARNCETKNYKPIDYFGNDQLPGYILGHERVDDDPSCQFGVIESAHIIDFDVPEEL